MNKVNLLIVTMLLLTAAAAQAADVVGKVGYMSGSLLAKRADGTIKVMGARSEVLAGDTLVTAGDSYAQVQMNDGAKMTLRPHSTLKIEEYQFNKQEPKSDNAVFRLLKGGFRTITGLIGKRGDPNAYKIRAAAATIGIRGTDFSSRLCATANCQDDPSPSAGPRGRSAPPPAPTPAAPDAAPPGLYVTVHSGLVVMAQADSVLNLGRGETGFAGAAALVRLPAPPAFMNVDTKQTNAIETKASKAEKAEAASQPDNGKADEKPKEDNGDGKSGDDKADSKPGEEKTDSVPSVEKDTINGADENADSPDPSVNQSGCVVQ